MLNNISKSIIKMISFFQIKLRQKYYYHQIGLFFFFSPFIFFYYIYQFKTYSFTKTISFVVRALSEITIPKFLRSYLFNLYIHKYEVNINDIIQPLQKFQNFSQFFTRKIIQRPIQKNSNFIVSPADCTLLNFKQIIKDQCFLIKNKNFSLGQFLTGFQGLSFDDKLINGLKKIKTNKLYQIIFYLAPGDYHRYHSPTDFFIQQVSLIKGKLYPVKPSYIQKHSKVYQKNQRVIIRGDNKNGALNVGSIILCFDQINLEQNNNKFYKDKIYIKKGEQMGMFKLGSTIVLLIQAKQLKLLVKQNDKLKYGQPILQYLNQNIIQN